MKCTRITRTYGQFKVHRTMNKQRGIVFWTGSDGIVNSLRAHRKFNELSDELFRKFMDKDDEQAYLDAWNTATDEMRSGTVVESTITDKNGKTRCIIHHDDDITWVKFFAKEVGE